MTKKFLLRIPKENFNTVYLPFLSDARRYHILYGGAGSGKSVFKAQDIVMRFFSGGHNILVVRKTGKSNRNSTYALIKQILNTWGIPKHLYVINKTEMTISNPINGSQIVFAGLDDVEKLKSTTFENGILTDVWVEEASEITEEDFNQLDLRLRGIAPVNFNITITFNPIDANHWIKKRFFDHKNKDAYVLKTTYLDNRFVDDQYKSILEELKTVDETYYKIYALGEWGVIGNIIYTNYEIHDFDYSNFDDFRQGLDFGFNHPSAGLKIAYYDGEVYVCDEVYQSGLTNTELIELVNEKLGKEDRCIADCAEPDRILEFKKAGFDCVPCKKGDSSVKAGIDWLKQHKIHIHKTNCPNTANEIETYKYREDRDGNVLDMPVKFKDDAMSALRYGTEEWRTGSGEETVLETVTSSFYGDWERQY